ncbi:MAG: hypothetical protein AAF999_17840 [Pseudomonadota bacterium]
MQIDIVTYVSRAALPPTAELTQAFLLEGLVLVEVIFGRPVRRLRLHRDGVGIPICRA